MFIEFYNFIPFKSLCEIKEYNGIVIMGILVVSYAIGLALSEVSKLRFFLKLLLKVKFIKTEPTDTNIVKEVLEYVDEADIKKALKKEQADYQINMKDLAYIYSVIQVENDYKRIHNYSSAQVMSRNFAMANIIGCLVVVGMMILKKCFNVLDNGFLCRYEIFFACLLVGISFLMARRCENFARKKYFYSVSWYISMSSKPKKENGESANR